MRHTKIYTAEGDITKIPADALITAINSGGMWYGGIDGAIQRVAGDLYHKQAKAAMPLRNLQTVVARGGARPDRKIGFRDVVFVVDDLESPLNEVIYTGLEAASEYKSVTIPTIRLGVMQGIIEKTPQEAIARMADGVNDFLDKYAEITKLENIKFVVYNNPILAETMSSVLNKI
ncbi:hypothetical protein J4456_00880 [Candidatus Pacearchaeota archaeon]|nr:hypothetical protein [Candidatus Pacearchaeota archaeon]